MRIVAGKYKGRVIPPAKKGQVRPTSDRVKESMFSTLASLCGFDGLQVLDLFAGSGALGLESISRGARGCVFVEENRVVAEKLEAFLQKLEVGEGVFVHREKAETFLSREKTHSPPVFDLVFLDPPYGKFNELNLLISICGSGKLNEGAWVVFESSRTIETEGLEPRLREVGSSLSLELEKDKSYGDTVVSYFRTYPRQLNE